MKFVHKANLKWCVPPWTGISVPNIADAIEQQLLRLRSERPALYPRNVNHPLQFWIEIVAKTAEIRIFAEEGSEFSGMLRIFCKDDTAIELPLNPLLHGHIDINQMHSVYFHELYGPGCPSMYVGVTVKKWFDRLTEHVASARRGSPYLFHRAIRERRFVRHKIVINGISHDAAMSHEEHFVSIGSLYPLGLNMIPGGFAGLRYLAKMGLRSRSVEHRDAVIEELVTKETVAGKPNPLCAARWASDPDYVDRVICGHSGRLTADQVRLIRSLATHGHPTSHIVATSGGKAVQVANVIAGKRYSRIRQW